MPADRWDFRRRNSSGIPEPRSGARIFGRPRRGFSSPAARWGSDRESPGKPPRRRRGVPPIGLDPQAPVLPLDSQQSQFPQGLIDRSLKMIEVEILGHEPPARFRPGLPLL